MALTVSVDQIVQGSRNPSLGARPHWKRVRLGDIASVLNGFAFKSAQFTKGDGMPLIRIRDVGSDSTDTNYVGEFEHRYIVEPGDLLIGMDGDFNCARWRGPRGLLNQRVCKVTLFSEQYHPRFLDFALPGYLKAINDATSSVTVKHLSSRTIEDIPLPFPTLHEQQKIVAELEKQFARLDESVANLKRVITRLAGYRERALDDTFTPELNATIGGLISEGPQNGLYLPKDAYGSGTPIVRIDDYQVDWMRPVAELRRVRATDAQVSTWALHPGDLLVNRVNSMSHLGKCVVVPDELAGALFESNMMRFRLLPGVLPRYVELYLGSRSGKRRLTANAKWAVNQASINQKDVQTTEIPLPSPERQAEIVAEVDRRLSIVREVDVEVDANLRRAQVLRQAVLAHAFAGAPPYGERTTSPRSAVPEIPAGGPQ
jgi:type I restriction enzyme S subunit